MIEITPILTAVRQAAALCRRVQQLRVAQSDKAADDPVTIADYGAQVILSRAISRAFPDDAIIAEEKGSQFLALVAEQQRQQIIRLLSEVLDEPVTEDDAVRWLDHGQNRTAGRIWAVDPIDGTKGFIAGRHYVIAVGLLRDYQPVAGVLGAPGFASPDDEGMLFYTLGRGALAEPLSGGTARRVYVSSREDMAAARMVESVVREHADHELHARIREVAGITQVEQMDSQEKYALIAGGQAEVYLRLPRAGKSGFQHSIWDHAAGVALVQAAGGQASDLDGAPLDFSQRRLLANRGVIASNGRVHDRFVRAVQSVWQSEE